MNNIQHIAIIMDGNGRYAQSLSKQRTFGHLQGTENVRNIAIAANKHKVKALTLYAFSTENWTRPLEEINYLMKLPALFIDKFLNELMDNDVRITMIGEEDKIPKDTLKVLKRAIEKTKDNNGMILNLAINYGFKSEMTIAIQNMIKDNVKPEDVNPELIDNYLMTKDLPPVDLLIRTSGEYRISNFLMWQLSYSELIFTDVPWPLFNEEKFDECIKEFYGRNRRFGGLNQ